jgi:hypothetical protein
MRWLWIVAGALLLACGPGTVFGGRRTPARYSYQIEPFGTVYSDIPLDPAALETRIAYAREIVASRGLIPRNEIENAFKDVPLHLESVYEGGMPHELEGRHIVGETKWTGIYVGQSLQGLVHEMLHWWDQTRLGVGSAVHLNWGTNGYLDADRIFQSTVGRFPNPVLLN